MEFHVEDTVKNKAIAAGYLVRKLKWIGRKSAPDHLFARADTGTFLIEFKDTGKDATVIQQREIARLREAGIRVEVIDTVAKGLKLLGIDE